MAKAWNQTRVSEVLGIEYPIIQGPLGGPHTGRCSIPPCSVASLATHQGTRRHTTGICTVQADPVYYGRHI